MNRISKALSQWGLLACVVIATTACQTAPGARFSGMEPVNAEMADVYIYKNDSIKIQRQFNVKISDGPASHLFNASYLFYRMAPGAYEIVVSPGPMMFNSRLHIEVKAGERKFYEYSSFANPFTIDFAIGSSLDERSFEVASRDLPKLLGARLTDAEKRSGKENTYEATGFASISDVNAVPKLNARGRDGYQKWLGQRFPRAFIIAEDGAWVATWNVFPDNPSESKDPLTRAVQRCQKQGHKDCKPYAIDRRVVWIPSEKPDDRVAQVK